MRLVLCIPAYNEASIIATTVTKVAESLQKLPNIEWQIVVANNGSTDGTEAAVQSLMMKQVSVLSVPIQGKGAALVAAAQSANADLFGFIDADLSADPDEFRLLLDAIQKGADVAIGSRLLASSHVSRGFMRTLTSKIFNTLRRLILGLHVTDTQCGLKLANTKGTLLLANCKETGWFIDVEWLARIERDGTLTLTEVPITWNEQVFPDRKSKLRVIRDGIGALRAFVRIARTLTSESVMR